MAAKTTDEKRKKIDKIIEVSVRIEVSFASCSIIPMRIIRVLCVSKTIYK